MKEKFKRVYWKMESVINSLSKASLSTQHVCILCLKTTKGKYLEMIFYFLLAVLNRIIIETILFDVQ